MSQASATANPKTASSPAWGPLWSIYLPPSAKKSSPHWAARKPPCRSLMRHNHRRCKKTVNVDTRQPGGSIANSIAGMAALGMATGFIGKIGDDDLGRVFADAL